MTTIAMMQMRVQPNELNRNLWHMRELLSLVGDTDVALFPECCDLGWAADSAPEQAEPIPEGSTYQRIRDMAVDFDIGIIAGITEREGDHIYNSAVFISNTGELLGKHRKSTSFPMSKTCILPEPRSTCSILSMVESASTYAPTTTWNRS